ncbi:VOC family protein [Pseudofrankia inefficax]|uniref:Glyoxalase/bleomycin resistance protein/dioxygenase n=1 Tax=Pseudofrankia inefficax (strain DSM 45817 / CECT 9037 / DDB 130130 / EuI1c) TaxID=298654 RepID=E3J3X5_PSEI1|nr:VOC family protein [Pseudofrankia inefficax]ADP80608.1 Glyoxalase/bleomycin resistance protein/dioxygenase [Pseudofrankia inefficax]
MRAAAVIYVGDLERMRAFYEGCFGLTPADGADGYRGLESDAWLLTLVRSGDAVPTATPPDRRSNTPVKLAFEVADIEALRPVAGALGGQVSPAATAWEFRDALHCDCVDPEGNVVQLVQARRPGKRLPAG